MDSVGIDKFTYKCTHNSSWSGFIVLYVIEHIRYSTHILLNTDARYQLDSVNNWDLSQQRDDRMRLMMQTPMTFSMVLHW